MSLKINSIENSSTQNLGSNTNIENNLKSFVSSNLDSIQSKLDEIYSSHAKL